MVMQQSATATAWMSVEDQLPKENGEYLVVEVGDTEASAADFCDGIWKTVRCFGQESEERELHSVTHWLPMPNGPCL